MFKNKSFILIFFIWIILVIAIFIGSTNSLLNISGKYYLDKIVHFSMYTIAAIIPAVMIRSNKAVILFGIALGFLGIAIEILQDHIPGRSFSYNDILANFTGILIGIVLGILLKTFVFKICPRK